MLSRYSLQHQWQLKRQRETTRLLHRRNSTTRLPPVKNE